MQIRSFPNFSVGVPLAGEAGTHSRVTGKSRVQGAAVRHVISEESSQVAVQTPQEPPVCDAENAYHLDVQTAAWGLDPVFIPSPAEPRFGVQELSLCLEH